MAEKKKATKKKVTKTEEVKKVVKAVAVKKKSTKVVPKSTGSGKTLLTKDGLKKIKEELVFLKKDKRKEVAARIKEAISYGDLSENSEYQEAKEEQAFVEGRILELEGKVKNAEVIKYSKAKVVQLGAKVTLKDLEKNEKVLFQIVGSTEANPMEGRISNESPLGKAIMEKRVGEKVEFIAPKGSVNYEILDLEY